MGELVASVVQHSRMTAPSHEQQDGVDEAKNILSKHGGVKKMLRQVACKMRARKGAAPHKHLHPASGTGLCRLHR